jgi:predicted DNA-binding transcriptional regulator AlpA
MLRGLLTIEQVSERSNLTVGTLWNLAGKGDLPPPRMVIGKRHFYAPSDISYWLKTRVDRRKLPRKARRKRIGSP